MTCCTPESACGDDLSRHLKPELFKALCDPRRIALLTRLAAARRPMTVSEASECCGVHISGTSRHLGQLRSAGVLVATRIGREVRYHVDVDRVVETLRSLADALEACCGGNASCLSPTDPQPPAESETGVEP